MYSCSRFPWLLILIWFDTGFHCFSQERSWEACRPVWLREDHTALSREGKELHTCNFHSLSAYEDCAATYSWNHLGGPCFWGNKEASEPPKWLKEWFPDSQVEWPSFWLHELNVLGSPSIWLARILRFAKQKADLWGAGRRVHVPEFLTNSQLIVFCDASPETQSLYTRHCELFPPTTSNLKGNFIITHIWAKHLPHRK